MKKPHYNIPTLLVFAATISLVGETSRAQTVEVTPGPPAVLRLGITGAGWAIVTGEGSSRRVTLHYPHHPDDFGGSTGSGTAHSPDEGRTWSAGEDNWPLPDTIDLWQDRLRGGALIAFGIHWAPDPAKRREITAADVPPDAYSIARSTDGITWTRETAVIDFPADLGVIARPLPRIFEDGNGALFMPAYAWGRSGNRSLLLKSEDGGRHWRYLSTITTAAEMVAAGAAVTTPWLESAVAPTSDGSWLAVVRTGSSEEAALMMTRSGDGGLTWSPVEKVLAGPEKQIVAGKLPGLALLPNGVLVLLTAHTKLGCRLYLSPDGSGRQWSGAQMVTKISGGNTSLVPLAADRLLVFTPANGRIHCWSVRISP